MKRIAPLALFLLFFAASACGTESASGQDQPSSRQSPMNQPSIDEVAARNYETVDRIAKEFNGSIELVDDLYMVCDSHATAPSCPDGGTKTHIMQYYVVHVSPIPDDFDKIVTGKIRESFPEAQGWSMTFGSLGRGMAYSFSNPDGWLISISHGSGVNATIGVSGRTPMVPVRPGDLDITGDANITPTHTPPPGKPSGKS